MINIICYCDGEILILKRSNNVSTYQGLWNGVSGFIDEPKHLEDFVIQEITEELSVNELNSSNVKIADPYQVDDSDIGRIWFVYPALVEFDVKPPVKIDWEHADYRWINPTELKGYRIVKDFDASVARALALR